MDPTRQWLEDNGALDIELITVKRNKYADTLDIEAGLDNDIREVPLDESVVQTYAAAMQEGAVFPPIVVRRRKTHDRPHVPVDGNHRIAAAMIAGVDLDAWLISCTDITYFTLAATANVAHGKPLQDRERVKLAVKLHKRYQITLREAARRMNVLASAVQAAMRVEHFNERVKTLDIKAVGEIKPSGKARLQQISNDETFTQAVHLVTDAGLKTPQVFDLVSKLNGLDAEAAKLYMNELAEESFNVAKLDASPYRVKLVDACTKVMGLNANAVVDSCKTAAQREMLEDTVRRTIKHLGDVANKVRQVG